MTASAPEPSAAANTTTRTLSSPITPAWTVAAAVFVGLACGAFEITNTSIGWHIAAGRWMLANVEILDRDVVSFTAEGSSWIDHEWLFQLLAAVLYDSWGAPALVGLRMLAVACVAVLLLRIGIGSGLDPPIALLLASLCVIAARPRFFIRPELATLILLPLALWLFATRGDRRWWPVSLAAAIVLGSNLHGGILVAPVLIGVWFAGEAIGQLVHCRPDRAALRTGAVGLAVAVAAPVLNPHGVAIWTVPFTLARLVRMPHIPNPEWLSPGPSDAPALYLALALVALVLAAGSRSPRHWLTTAAAAALALRHIRNLGIFFVLLPITVAPALARWPLFRHTKGGGQSARVRATVCAGLVAVIAAAALARPWPALGMGFAERRYPDRAWGFLESHSLLEGRLYNDVVFGGWIALQGDPLRQVFLDDRNEIHEPLLAEIWEIFTTSDVNAWESMLDRWDIDTVLLRYHEPIRVATPDGVELGRRGFSTLWFPSSRWATVYWDDAVIVLVRRSSVSPRLLAEREYHVLHPDDLEFIASRAATDPELRRALADELARALRDNPDCLRARRLAVELAQPSGP